MKIWLRVIYLSIISLTGCNKNSEVENDSQAPVISIRSPVEAQVFTAGQYVNINGTITDDTYIAEVHIHVTNTNTSALLMDVHLYPAGPSAIFSQTFEAAAGVNYTITVTAKDKAINEARSRVGISAN